MDDISIPSPEIGKTPQQRDNDPAVSSAIERVKYLPARTNRDRSASEAFTSAPSSFYDTPHSNFDGNPASRRLRSTSTTFTTDLRAFCTGQPPKQSFLTPQGSSPPLFRTVRRSTLADKLELDSLLESLTVMYKGEEFLQLNTNTVQCLSQYLNGSKPVARTSLFDRLMITDETNKVHPDRFHAVVKQIGVYCKHLAIVAPFHTIESGNIFHRETEDLESGSDWEKILPCLSNLCVLSFEHPAEEPANLTRDAFYALNYALTNDDTLQKLEKVLLYVPPRVLFDYHQDFHARQHGAASPRSSITSSPLTIVSSNMIYADGSKVIGSFDDDVFAFGTVDDIKKVDV